jgi:hypothetical protein
MSKIDADEADQELVMDQSAYEMYHQAQTSKYSLVFHFFFIKQVLDLFKIKLNKKLSTNLP